MTQEADRLNELVGWLADTAKSTEAFVLEQAPDVARQIVAWGLWSSVFWLSVCVPFVMVGLWLLAKAFRTFKNGDPDCDAFTLIVVGVILCFPIVGVIDNAAQIVKIKVAPKVYLIEAAARMLK